MSRDPKADLCHSFASLFLANTTAQIAENHTLCCAVRLAGAASFSDAINPRPAEPFRPDAGNGVAADTRTANHRSLPRP
jgi:hypothetical protein